MVRNRKLMKKRGGGRYSKQCRAHQYYYTSAPAIYMHRMYTVFFSQPTDLLALSVRGGVVCDLEVAEVEDVLHLIVVSPPLANNDGYVK